jgi:hypothetical protein
MSLGPMLYFYLSPSWLGVDVDLIGCLKTVVLAMWRCRIKGS